MHQVGLGDTRGRPNPGRQWLAQVIQDQHLGANRVKIEKLLTIEKFVNQCPVVSRVLGLQGYV